MLRDRLLRLFRASGPRRPRRLLSALACAAAVAACGGDSGSDAAPKSPADDMTVTVSGGAVKADRVGGVRRFLKIPYAKPPTGDLRWKAPVKADPWKDTRHETAFADPCPQASSTQAPGSNNEDCLYLNVWSPEPAPAKAPVMVWIHGGGNFAGSAADQVPGLGDKPQLWYDGQFFAATPRRRGRHVQLPPGADGLLRPPRPGRRGVAPRQPGAARSAGRLPVGPRQHRRVRRRRGQRHDLRRVRRLGATSATTSPRP